MSVTCSEPTSLPTLRVVEPRLAPETRDVTSRFRIEGC